MAARAPMPGPIPAPLTGVPFLKASHLQLGASRGVPQENSRPFSHVQFPPFWGDHRPTPAEPPRSGDVLGRSGAEGGRRCSETRLAFPEKPLQRVVPTLPPAPCIRMHADPRIRICSSAMRDSYPYPAAPPHNPPSPRCRRAVIEFFVETERKSHSLHQSTPPHIQHTRSTLLPGRVTHTGVRAPTLRAAWDPHTGTGGGPAQNRAANH